MILKLGQDVFFHIFYEGEPINTVGEFTFLTDFCIHYVLKNSVLHYRMSEHVKAKAIPLHATGSLARRGGTASTHSRPRY
jgi:hypothetical protein